MGSFLKPKAVPVPQAPKPKTQSVVTTQPVTSAEPALSDDETQTKAREQSLLRRNRGRFGTIETGFRGFLSPAEKNNRKTLLGE